MPCSLQFCHQGRYLMGDRLRGGVQARPQKQNLSSTGWIELMQLCFGRCGAKGKATDTANIDRHACMMHSRCPPAKLHVSLHEPIWSRCRCSWSSTSAVKPESSNQVVRPICALLWHRMCTMLCKWMCFNAKIVGWRCLQWCWNWGVDPGGIWRVSMSHRCCWLSLVVQESGTHQAFQTVIRV